MKETGVDGQLALIFRAGDRAYLVLAIETDSDHSYRGQPGETRTSLKQLVNLTKHSDLLEFLWKSKDIFVEFFFYLFN